MILRSRTLSSVLFSTLFFMHLGACSSQDVATEETVQATEDQAPAEASASTETSEKDKAIAEASGSDFTDPSEVQLSGDAPASVAAVEAPADVPEATAVDGVDSSMPAPVVPDLTADTSGSASISGGVSVYFAKSSSRVTREYRDQLKELADKLKNDRSTKVSLSGHCDNRGSAAFNRRLANKRARAVKSALVRMGVKSNQISIGAAQLAQSGESEQEHAQNRRVEVEFQ